MGLGKKGIKGGECDLGCWIFNFSPRLRDTLTRGLGKRWLTPSPDKSAGQVRGRAEGLVRYGDSGLRALTKPTTGLVANIAD